MLLIGSGISQVVSGGSAVVVRGKRRSTYHSIIVSCAYSVAAQVVIVVVLFFECYLGFKFSLYLNLNLLRGSGSGILLNLIPRYKKIRFAFPSDAPLPSFSTL